MHTFIENRKADLQDAGDANDKRRGDILSRLVAAMESDGKLNLDEQEVLGSIFTHMFAGHGLSQCSLASHL
jgi:cytochrome P450